MEFKALLVEQPEKKVFNRSIVTRSLDDLPEGELVSRFTTLPSISRMLSRRSGTRV